MMGSMPPANAKPLYKLGLDAVLAGYKEGRPQPVA
jgi:hypothetical protein